MSSKGHEVYYLAHAFQGTRLNAPIKAVFNGEEKIINYTILSSERMPYCSDVFEKYIKEINPDIVGVLLDTFMVMENPNNWFLSTDLAPAKSLFYFPSDGEKFPQKPGVNCENVLRKVNQPVAMAKHGQNQVKNLFGINSKYIPHGVDCEVFKPLDKERLKAKYNLNGKFVIGSVFRNQGRKMPDRIIKTFAEFSKGKDDVVLLLHTDPNDVAAPVDLFKLIREYNVQNKVRFTGLNFFKPFSTNQLVEIYNTFDVFYLPTSGEGFGIPIIEAMACEVPVVVTDYTTTNELVSENASGIAVPLAGDKCSNYDIYDGEITGGWGVERGLISITEAVKSLNKLYSDKELRLKFGKNGRNACLTYYDWKIILPEWEKLMENMLK